MAADPTKIKAITEWPNPTSVKGLCGFLGLSGFYRNFIRNYAVIAQPLTNLLKEGNFQWSTEAQGAFEALKLAMVSAPILALPYFSEIFVVQTDSSGFSMGVVLLQLDHPIAYFSKVLYPILSRASTYIRELHAITCAVKR